MIFCLDKSQFLTTCRVILTFKHQIFKFLLSWSCQLFSKTIGSSTLRTVGSCQSCHTRFAHGHLTSIAFLLSIFIVVRSQQTKTHQTLKIVFEAFIFLLTYYFNIKFRMNSVFFLILVYHFNKTE
jgi:hypothetical protein